jgi:uncharacterized protein (TIGR04222 family)
MNFLFDNPLANMPGGWFLLLYGTIIVITAISIKVYKPNLDWTSKLPIPLVPQNPNPFELAFLRGGDNEFVRTLIFSLVQKGFLEINSQGKKSFIKLTVSQPNWTTLSPLERSVLPCFQTSRETTELFAKEGLTEILKPYTLTYDQQLARLNFITPTDVATKTRLISLLAWGGTSLLGIYKLCGAILHGRKNFGFLIFFVIVSTVIFYVLSKTSRLSLLGKKYVNQIQQAFENLKTTVQRNISTDNNENYGLNTVDPFLLSVGVFGVGALSGTLYNDYQQTFQRANVTGGSSCGSGCASSCSSGSSGDGGGGCGGGGGGCGGGCS